MSDATQDMNEHLETPGAEGCCNVLPPADSACPPAAVKKAGRRCRTVVKRRKKNEEVPVAWRLADSYYDELNSECNFTVEACCDQQGMNRHNASLLYYSSENSFLDSDVTGESVFINPPWKLAKECITHIRDCHSKNPKGTKAVIVLPDWYTFKESTKDLRLIRTIPAKTAGIFTKSPESDGSVREPVAPAPWPINFWGVDENTPILSKSSNSSSEPEPEATVDSQDVAGDENQPNEKDPDNIMANTMDDEAARNAAAQWLPTASACVIMDPNEPEPLMRVETRFEDIDVSALIDSAATLNFVSKEFVDAHGLQKNCKQVPKMTVRVANSQRISTTKIITPEKLIINNKNYSNIQFRVLPHLKCADVILGLPALKDMDMTINVKKKTVNLGGVEVPCTQEDRRVTCFLLDGDKLAKLVAKANRSKKQTSDFFAISLQLAEQIASVKTDFGEDFDEKIQSLLNEFEDVAQDFKGLPPHRGDLDHFVKLKGYPKRQRRNRLSPPEFEELKKQCIDLFEQGRIRISSSPYAAPIILVRKPDGSMRMCIDYRGINEFTVRDAYPLPRIDELLEQLRTAKVISHLDLQQGYNQVRMSDTGPEDESIASTAFQGVTPSGAPCLLEFLVMPFGLCNAPATFSRLMNRVLEPWLNKFVLVYLDDIAIYSESPEEHLIHLRMVLTALRKEKLHIKLSKCTWGKRESEYLGVIAGNGNLRPSPDKLAAIEKWPLPQTQKQVKSFVAFCSFYRKFVHHFADCSAPLTDMCRKGKPGKVVWDSHARDAFEILKARMISAPLLLIPKCGADAEFIVATDASDVGLGAVLLQDDGSGNVRPCAYWARKLNDAERNYSAYDKEALAVVEATTRVWRMYLDGALSITVVTDHATLTHLLKQPSKNLSPRQARYVERLMPYCSYMKILYRKGTANEADPVSRRPDFYSIWWDGEVPNESEEKSVGFFLELSAEEISINEEFEKKLKAVYKSAKYFDDNGPWKRDGLVLSNGLFLYHGRVVIPRTAHELRDLLMKEMHDNAGHPNWRRLLASLLKKYWWKGIAADCKNYCNQCIECNRSKPHRRGAAAVHPLPVPQYPWEVVGVDYVTSLPKSGKEGYTAVMIIVDHLTKMAHFIPTTDEVTAQQSADMFVHHCYRLHGCPRVLVSDRDPRFISEFWQSLWRKLNTRLNMSTARRPQTDGLTERVNETMQSLLRCYCAEAGYDWSDHLDMIEFQYNSFRSDATQHSPFETIYGFQPAAPIDRMLPLEGAEPAAAERLSQLADTQAVVRELLKLSKERQAARRTSYTPTFEPGDKVYLSTKGLNIKSQACQKLKDRFIGPYTVIAAVGQTSYRLQLPQGYRLHPVFHVDNLKPAVSDVPLRILPFDAVNDDSDYGVDRIVEAKLDRWPNRRGLYVLFKTYYTGYDTPEWSLYELLDDTEALDKFLKTDSWRTFSSDKPYIEFCKKYPRRAVIL